MADSLDPYASIAEFYDLEHDDFFDDVEMYLHFAATVGNPVLELACGSGRIAAPLADAGFEVTGVDSSATMLERARLRSVTKPQNLTLLPADMRQADSISGGPFALVILALGALGHLTESHDQIAALEAVARALEPGGMAVIDMMHPAPGRLYGLDESLGLDGHWTLDSGGNVDRFSTHAIHSADQLIESRIWFDIAAPSGELTRHATTLTQRYVSPGELALMLDIAGFEEITFYGDYDLRPFDDDADRMIAVARTAES